MATQIGAGKARGSIYRGGPGMATWILHRVTGVLLFFFLFAHILDTALVLVGADVYNGVIGVYHNPIIRLMEVALVVSVLFHALNGIKIVLIDFWSKGVERAKELGAITMLLFVVLAAGATFSMGKQIIDEIRADDGHVEAAADEVG